MAKLSAHGCTMMASAYWEQHMPDAPNDDMDVVWRRAERRLMSDGKVLEKCQVRWANGRLHDWGWKVIDTLKEGFVPVLWTTYYRRAGWATQVHQDL